MNTAEILFTPFKAGLKEGAKQFVRETIPEKKPRQVVFKPQQKKDEAELEKLRLELMLLMSSSRNTHSEVKTSSSVINPLPKSGQLPSLLHSF